MSKYKRVGHQESIHELEGSLFRGSLFGNEDSFWVQLQADTDYNDDYSFSWNAVRELARLAYLYWIENPIIHQGVEVTSDYIFGQGMNINSEDENVKTQAREIWSEPDMQKHLTGSAGLQRQASRLQVFGNLFWGLRPKNELNLDKDHSRLFHINLNQLQDAQVDDYGNVVAWLYSRYEKNKKDYKPRWIPSTEYYKLADEIEPLQNYPVDKSFAIQHIHSGSLVGILGLPTFYSSIAWARAYKESLEDFSVVQRSLRTFAWRAMGRGSDGVRNISNMVTDARNEANMTPEGMGRFAVSGMDGGSLQPIRTSNYQTPADGSRRLLLMACAGFGLPETYFGDVSVGTYATAETVERPVELRMRAKQSLWSAAIENTISFLLNGDNEYEKDINVSFPPILEHASGPFMQAVQMADGLSYEIMPPETMARVALQALGVDDIEDELDKLKEGNFFDKTRQEKTLEVQQKYAPDPMQAPEKRDFTKNANNKPPGGPSGKGKQYPKESDEDIFYEEKDVIFTMEELAQALNETYPDLSVTVKPTTHDDYRA